MNVRQRRQAVDLKCSEQALEMHNENRPEAWLKAQLALGVEKVQLVWPGNDYVEAPLVALTNTIHIIDELVEVVDCLGLELKVAYELEYNSGMLEARNTFLRIAQEPIILSNWNRILTLDFLDTEALNLVSTLCGWKIGFRKQSMWATSQGVVVVFEELKDANKWKLDIQQIRAMDLEPLVEAIMIHARVVFSHPFEDGNGRFARAIFYSALGRSGLVRGPCLALGSGLSAFKLELANACMKLSYDGNWTNYISTVSNCLSACVENVFRIVHRLK